ncbi:uncharacterized protein LOC143373863 isoform X2 [Andrena cerasifolii]|uniref:uncharacterized protein LOC143373863 isoform X2 n=1 Tax=Andrena cerasifolii TaxID=2819439 RepID=UPI00403841BD
MFNHRSLPTWEVTKYYGRVCIYQLKCVKYRVQTSEAWFNFKCKFMPGSLQKELECEELVPKKVTDKQSTQQQGQKEKVSPKTATLQKQSPVQYDSKRKENDCPTSSYNDTKSSYLTEEYPSSAKSKKARENETCQGNEEYSMSNDFARKKKRKTDETCSVTRNSTKQPKR